VYKHVIPPIVDGTRCVPIFIPDSPEYAQLLVFAVRRITQQNYYQRDDARRAKAVADLLKEITLEPLIASLLSDEDCAMLDCGQVEDCLDDSPTIEIIKGDIVVNKNYVNKYSVGINEVISDRNETGVLETPYIALPTPPSGYPCNYDALWAGCLSVVEYLNTITVDLLEQLTAANDQNERYATMIEAIPFLADFPLDEALEYTAYVSQELENSYNGTVTLAFKQAVACELFCKLQANCDSLSSSNLLDYLFIDRLGVADNYASLAITMSQAILFGLPMDNVWVGEDMAIGMWATSMWIASMKAEFFGGFGDKNINIAYRMGINSPDNDWSILCDCVDLAWTHTFDFTIDEQGWLPANNSGMGNDALYVSGVDWRGVYNPGGGGNSILTMYWTNAIGVELHEVSVTYKYDNTADYSYHGFYIQPDTTGGTPIHVFNIPSPDTNVNTITETNGFDGYWAVAKRLNIIIHRASSGGSSAQQHIYSVTLKGRGYNPFI